MDPVDRRPLRRLHHHWQNPGPAVTAAWCCPKFRLNRSSSIRQSSSAANSRIRDVSSLLPSSTKMLNSHVIPGRSVSRSRGSISGMDSASFNTGITIERNMGAFPENIDQLSRKGVTLKRESTQELRRTLRNPLPTMRRARTSLLAELMSLGKGAGKVMPMVVKAALIEPARLVMPAVAAIATNAISNAYRSNPARHPSADTRNFRYNC